MLGGPTLGGLYCGSYFVAGIAFIVVPTTLLGTVMIIPLVALQAGAPLPFAVSPLLTGLPAIGINGETA